MAHTTAGQNEVRKNTRTKVSMILFSQRAVRGALGERENCPNGMQFRRSSLCLERALVQAVPNRRWEDASLERAPE